MFKLLMTAMLFSAVAQATELDPVNQQIPSEIIVREDASGKREVFKVEAKVNVTDSQSAEQVIEKFVKSDNKVSEIVLESELDRSSSTEAWYYWGWGNYGQNYGYNWYGYNYYYRPYYSYNWGYYNYYYYRWW